MSTYNSYDAQSLSTDSNLQENTKGMKMNIIIESTTGSGHEQSSDAQTQFTKKTVIGEHNGSITFQKISSKEIKINKLPLFMAENENAFFDIQNVEVQDKVSKMLQLDFLPDPKLEDEGDKKCNTDRKIDTIVPDKMMDIVSLEDAQREIQVKKKIRKIIKGWRDLDQTEIRLKRLSGLSNIVYMAEALNENFEEMNENKLKHVIVKLVVGVSQEEKPFTKNYEKVMKYLESQNIGPICLYEDKAMRIDEYIYNREMTAAQMAQQKYRLWVMQPLADFLDNKAKPVDFGGKIFINQLLEDYGLMTLIQEKIQTYHLSEEEKITLKKALEVIEDSEVNFVRNIFKNYKTEDLYLSHNDLYNENILFDTKRKKLFLIDFEYASLNPFGFDIANIVNETLFDYAVATAPFYSYNPSNLPTEKNIKEMIRALFTFWDNKKLRFDSEDADDFEMNLKNCMEFYAIDEERIEKQYKITIACNVINNYFYLLWTLWWLRNDEFNFDYILYARDRTKSYLKFKKLYTELCKESSY